MPSAAEIADLAKAAGVTGDALVAFTLGFQAAAKAQPQGGDAKRRKKGMCLPPTSGATTRSCGPHSIATVLQALTGKPTTAESVSYLGHSSLRSVLDYGLGHAEAGDLVWALSDATLHTDDAYPVDVEVIPVGPHVSVEAFRKECVDCASDVNICLVINYHVGTAHGFPADSGVGQFGHWSAVSTYFAETDEVLVTDADPISFGSHWRCPLVKLHESMMRTDQTGTERGFLRLALKGLPPSPLAHLSAAPTRAIIERWEARQPKPARGRAVVKALYDEFYFPTKPYSCVHYLSILTYALQKLGVKVDVDTLIARQRLPCQIGLRDGPDGKRNTWRRASYHSVEEMAAVAKAAAGCGLYVECAHLREAKPGGKPKCTVEEFRAFVGRTAGPASHTQEMILLGFDTVSAHKYREGGKGNEDKVHWGMVAGYDAATDSILIADSDFDTYGRIWYCAVPDMYAAVTKTGEHGVVRICLPVLPKGAIGLAPAPAVDAVGEPLRLTLDWKQASVEELREARRGMTCLSDSCNALNGLATLALAFASLGIFVDEGGVRYTGDAGLLDQLVWTVMELPGNDVAVLTTLRTTLSSLYSYTAKLSVAHDLPLECEVFHFDPIEGEGLKPITVEDLRAAIIEAVELQGKERRVHALIFNFADEKALGLTGAAGPARGGVSAKVGSKGHFALFLEYDKEGDKVTMLDPVFGYRTMTMQELYDAVKTFEGGDNALDKAGRYRGILRLALTDHQEFKPLHLGRCEVTTKAHFTKLQNHFHLDYQQALNCCGAVSIGYSLSSLGYPYRCDDVFAANGTRIRRVVSGEGFSLFQEHQACAEFVARKGLPFKVETVHCDPGRVDLKEFEKLAAETAADDSAAMILNFNVGHAHRMGIFGGHFSVLADCKDGFLYVCDVNPMKYLPVWKTPVECMFAGMCDEAKAAGAYMYGKGGPGKRSRGFVRISAEGSPPLDPKIWPSVLECPPVSWYREQIALGAELP